MFGDRSQKHRAVLFEHAAKESGELFVKSSPLSFFLRSRLVVFEKHADGNEKHVRLF